MNHIFYKCGCGADSDKDHSPVVSYDILKSLGKNGTQSLQHILFTNAHWETGNGKRYCELNLGCHFCQNVIQVPDFQHSKY